MCTTSYGARLSSVPSGDRSASPATDGASGGSSLQRALLSASASRNTGKLRDSPPLWGSLEQLEQPSLAGPSLQVTELAALSTPQETGSPSRLFRSMETTAKCVSMGPAHCKKENIVFSLGLRRQLSTGSFPRWWVPSRLWLWNKKQTPS